jgi:hypothetical protein
MAGTGLEASGDSFEIFPQHLLNFKPLPHGQASLRDGFIKSFLWPNLGNLDFVCTAAEGSLLAACFYATRFVNRPPNWVGELHHGLSVKHRHCSFAGAFT